MPLTETQWRSRPVWRRLRIAAGRKIIRTGSLELTVTNPADAAEQVRIMAERMGGYLESAQIGGTKAAPDRQHHDSHTRHAL